MQSILDLCNLDDTLVINGLKNWKKYDRDDEDIYFDYKLEYDTVIIINIGDLHPYPNGPRFTCKNLFFINCDKNFVYYWINKFDSLENMFMFSHPCESRILYKLIDNKTNIFLSYKYEYRIKSFSNDDKNKITIISEDIITDLLDYFII